MGPWAPGMMFPPMQPTMPGMMNPAMGFPQYPPMPGMMGPVMGGTPYPPTPGMMPQSWVPGQLMSAPYGAFHCPQCGYSGPEWHAGPSYAQGLGAPGFGPYPGAWGLGGVRRWGGAYSPQFIATGLPTDEEIEEMIYDALDADPMIPYDADISVAVDTGVVTLTGTVANKRTKHAAGDDVWWVPGVVDVNNEVAVTGRRKIRSAPSETETGATIS